MKNSLIKFVFFVVLTVALIAFSNFAFKIQKNSISAVIVSHHDLVKEKRAEIFSILSGLIRPKTVVLVSTNHFDAGTSPIATTSKIWQTSRGQISPDLEKIAKLAVNRAAASEDLAFAREHGITNILGDIAGTYPEAKIIPITIKSTASRDKISQLSDALNDVCHNECLAIFSIDFSHYQPGALAQLHDNFSIKALNQLDENLAWGAETDSPQGLLMAVQWAKLQNSSYFRLKTNTNSGIMVGNPDAESTSYVMGWFEKGKRAQVNSKTFVSGYDLDRFKEKNPRLIEGVDERYDFKNYTNGCRVKYPCELWENPIIAQQMRDGLIIAGETAPEEDRLVLVPTNKEATLQYTPKLKAINEFRKNFGLDPVNWEYGYDVINLAK